MIKLRKTKSRKIECNRRRTHVAYSARPLSSAHRRRRGRQAYLPRSKSNHRKATAESRIERKRLLEGTLIPVRVASCRLQGRPITLSLTQTESDFTVRGEYERLQCRVYAQHGVTSAKRISDACAASCTNLIVAHSSDGMLLGGLRIHRPGRGRLPLQQALPRSRRLSRVLASLSDPCELSGTVVAPSERGTGLSAAIVGAAVASLPLLGIHSALGFGHQRVLPLYAGFGFMVDPHLGCHPYPDTRYRSQVAVLRDAAGLHAADPSMKSRALDLRAQFEVP